MRSLFPSQVNPMTKIREFVIKNLRIRSLPMAYFLLQHMPKLRKAGTWIVDLTNAECREFVEHLKPYQERGLELSYKLS